MQFKDLLLIKVKHTQLRANIQYRILKTQFSLSWEPYIKMSQHLFSCYFNCCDFTQLFHVTLISPLHSLTYTWYIDCRLMCSVIQDNTLVIEYYSVMSGFSSKGWNVPCRHICDVITVIHISVEWSLSLRCVCLEIKKMMRSTGKVYCTNQKLPSSFKVIDLCLPSSFCCEASHLFRWFLDLYKKYILNRQQT